MSTRSGLIYNKPTALTLPKIKTSEYINQVSTRPQRSTRTKFSADIIRELCQTDDDDSLNYSTDDEEVQQYTCSTFIPPPPRYAVNIDFDEASDAWRVNKRRIGEQWAYRRVQKTQPVKETTAHLRRSTRIAKST